jgi:diguanylate cyclase (GGDEF)-like protein/PAS domain S-box-containing protein
MPLHRSDRAWRARFESSPVAQLLQEPFSRIAIVNDSFLVLSGRTGCALEGADIGASGLGAQDDLGAILWDVLRAQRVVQGFQLHLARPDGALLTLRVASRAVTLDGTVYHLHSFTDITAHKAQQIQVKLAAQVLSQGREGIMVTDAQRAFVLVNQAFKNISGFSQDDLVGKNPKVLSLGRQTSEFFQSIWKDVNLLGSWQGEVWILRKGRTEYLEWRTISVGRDAQGTICNYVVTSSDISEQFAARERITWLSHFDELTGLPNRTLFIDRLGSELRRAQRSGLKVAVLLLDLDHFKAINDAMGHEQGDSLLVEAARRIRACVRESDTVARMGGDEFAVIVSEIDESWTVDKIVQNLLEALAQPYSLKVVSSYVSASLGVSLFPGDAEDIEGLLGAADQAMYAAKAAGRNRFSFLTPDLQQSAQNHMWLANELRVALKSGQFWLTFQPIMDLATGRVHKAEALLRWQHPVRGLISPAEFIPIAESSGLIVEIGEWVFAAAQVKLCRSQFHSDFQISVNKSPVQFHRAALCSMSWPQQLEAMGLGGDSIVVEITEGVLLDSSQGVDEQLLELRAGGIQVSLDDFGTGYSSMAYLQKHDIDFVKIDQSFVRNVSAGSKQLALCEAIVVMDHKLGIKVIAEGIETNEQLELLRLAGCEYGQGYLFARPMPAHEFALFLAQRTPVSARLQATPAYSP